MKAAAPPPAAKFAIVSEAFCKLTEPESALLESYARGYMALQNSGELPPLKRWEIIFGQASEGDAEALKKLAEFPTSDAYISWDTARVRGLYATLTRQCVERWPQCIELAKRVRAVAEKTLSEYRGTACPYRERLELAPRPNVDEVTSTLEAVIQSCVEVEAGPVMSAQLSEPPRPTFYGLEQIG